MASPTGSKASCSAATVLSPRLAPRFAVSRYRPSTLGPFGPDAVHQRYIGYSLRRHHAPSRQLAHAREVPLAVGVGVLFEDGDPEPRCGQRRYYFPEPPTKQVARSRVLETLHPLGEARGREAAPGLTHVILYALFEAQRLPAGRVGPGVVPVRVKHPRCGVEVHEHEATTRFQDGGNAIGPG